MLQRADGLSASMLEKESIGGDNGKHRGNKNDMADPLPFKDVQSASPVTESSESQAKTVPAAPLETLSETSSPTALSPPVSAMLKFANFSAMLRSHAEREDWSTEFLLGAAEMYRLAQDAMAVQLKSKVERIKEVRKLRVKARRMSIKITKLLRS